MLHEHDKQKAPENFEYFIILRLPVVLKLP